MKGSFIPGPRDRRLELHLGEHQTAMDQGKNREPQQRQIDLLLDLSGSAAIILQARAVPRHPSLSADAAPRLDGIKVGISESTRTQPLAPVPNRRYELLAHAPGASSPRSRLQPLAGWQSREWTAPGREERLRYRG